MGRPLRARSPCPGHSAAHPLNQQEKTHVFSNGNHGKSGRRKGRTSVGARQGSTRRQLNPKRLVFARQRAPGLRGATARQQGGRFPASWPREKVAWKAWPVGRNMIKRRSRGFAERVSNNVEQALLEVGWHLHIQ